MVNPYSYIKLLPLFYKMFFLTEVFYLKTKLFKWLRWKLHFQNDSKVTLKTGGYWTRVIVLILGSKLNLSIIQNSSSQIIYPSIEASCNWFKRVRRVWWSRWVCPFPFVVLFFYLFECPHPFFSLSIRKLICPV